MTLHWEDALNRVAAAAAATLRDGDKSNDESSNNQKEGNPEHDAGKQVEGLLLSNITSENDINSFAVIAVKPVNNGLTARRFGERQNKHIPNREECIDSASNSDGISSATSSISSTLTETVGCDRRLTNSRISAFIIECETIIGE